MGDKQHQLAAAPPPVFEPKQLEDENPMPEENTQEPLRQYSNEARAYHARYAELSEAHDNGKYNVCREGCLDLLTEPNVPYYTRVQTLQMLSTILAPPAAESCLQDAAAMLAKMDNTTFQVQLLTRDNEMMQADLVESIRKRDLIGDAEAGQRSNAAVGEWDFTDGDSPGETYHEFDRVLQEQRELGIAARQKAEASGSGNVFGDVNAEEQLTFEQKIATQGVKVRGGIAAQQEILQAQEDEAARSEAQTPNDSMFERLSPGESMFTRPSTGMSMYSTRSGSPGGSMLHTGGNGKEVASTGIDTVLSDAAIKHARAQTDAGRAELAASEAKLADITAKLRALKTGDAPDLSTEPPDLFSAPPEDVFPDIENLKIGEGKKPVEHDKDNENEDEGKDDGGKDDEGKADGADGAKKGFRKSGRALLGAFGITGKGDAKKNA